MLGKFERTSEAYREGVRVGRAEARRDCLVVLEKMIWDHSKDGALEPVELMNALRALRAVPALPTGIMTR